MQLAQTLYRQSNNSFYHVWQFFNYSMRLDHAPDRSKQKPCMLPDVLRVAQTHTTCMYRVLGGYFTYNHLIWNMAAGPNLLLAQPGIVHKPKAICAILQSDYTKRHHTSIGLVAVKHLILLEIVSDSNTQNLSKRVTCYENRNQAKSYTSWFFPINSLQLSLTQSNDRFRICLTHS